MGWSSRGAPPSTAQVLCLSRAAGWCRESAFEQRENKQNEGLLPGMQP